MIKNVRILYFGTPVMSSILLNYMLESGFNIIGLVAQPDKPVGRKKIIEEVPTKKVARKFNIPVYQFEKLKPNIDFFKTLNIDLILTFAYGKILPEELLFIPKYKSLNIHASLLPKYRGASPIHYALLNGDEETGVSLMEMSKEMDAGRVFSERKILISNDDNYDSLTKKVSDAAILIVKEDLEKVINDTLKPIEQDLKKVTFTKKIEDNDCLLNFKEFDAFSINNKIRALSMQPGAYFVYKNTKYKILKAKIVNKSYSPNLIVSFNKNEFIISCKNNSISILTLQKEGKKVLDFKDFYNGNKDSFLANDVIN